LEAVIYTRPRYDRAYRNLTPQQQARVVAAIARLSQSFGHPHRHSGLGIRPFGRYFEFRVGLGLRVLFLSEGADLFLSFVGTHDEVRAFLKSDA
jgi:hypothetical protein